MARTARPALIDAMIQQESGGDPNAVNPRTGAIGLMQIMPATARKPGFGIKPISVRDLRDPVKNRAFGTKYINAMLGKFNGNVANALSAYNFGPAATDKWLRSGARFSGLPDETRNYIVNILGNRGAAPQGIGLPDGPQASAASGDVAASNAQNPEVRGSLQREGEDLSGMSQDDLDAAQKILTRQKGRSEKAARAAQAEQARLQARRQGFLRKLANSRSSAPAPNTRPAPVGSPGRIPLQAAQAQAVSAAPVDPLATQQALNQGLINPATSGGLLGARNLGPTGLLRPVPRRS